MSTTQQLQLYNDALLVAGERALSTITDDIEARYLLDQVWANGGVRACLEEAQWTFAMRTIQIDYDPSIEPSYGYNRAFVKPDDWVLTAGICSDEFFRVPLLQYIDEAGYWFSSLDTIYVRYVSDDAAYGGDLGNWPKTFWDFVATHFAGRLVLKLANSADRVRLILSPENPRAGLRYRALMRAKSSSAMANPTAIASQGEWSKARTRGVNRRDGGSSGSLIG